MVRLPDGLEHVPGMRLRVGIWSGWFGVVSAVELVRMRGKRWQGQGDRMVHALALCLALAARSSYSCIRIKRDSQAMVR